jgi:drug/metabolite transporter (DMT)-like permease
MESLSRAPASVAKPPRVAHRGKRRNNIGRPSPSPRRSAARHRFFPAGETISMTQREAGLAQVGGISLMLLGCMFLTLGDAFSKLLTTTYPVGQIIFARSIVILVIAAAVCAWQGSVASVRPHSLRNQLRRAGYFVVSTFLVNWSLKLLPLPVAHAILFATPIIMTALAPALLAEKVGASRWAAVIVGFAGVVVIIDPARESWQWTAIVPLCAAFAAALRDLATREMAGAESTMSLLIFMAAATGVVSVMTAPFGWAVPTWPDLALMLAFGLATTTALFLQVLAFRAAEAGLLAPFKYSSIVWSILLGFLLWGYVPTLPMLGGIAIVIGSGLFILQREIASRRKRVVPQA